MTPQQSLPTGPLRRLTVAVGLIGLIAVSCSDDDRSNVTSATTETPITTVASDTTVAPTTTAAPPTTQPTTSTTAPPVSCISQGDIAAQTSGEPLTISPLFGSDIAASASSGVEAITIRFSGQLSDPTGLPGWSVEYCEDFAPPAGSTVDGVATLLIRVGAMMPNGNGDGYSGPLVFVPAGVSHILEISQVANADGSATWAVTLDAEYPFDVSVPDGPARIVIALQTGP